MKLFGSTKNLINKIKNAEKELSLEIILVQFNLANDQYQQKSEVLYTITPNKSCAYLLNVEARNLVFLKTYNREFDGIMILAFIDEKSRLLEIGNNVNLRLCINKWKWRVIL